MLNRQLVIPLWKGETVFIIGGGSSLKNFDYSPLKGEKVIGTNRAFILGDWVQVCLMGDLDFWKEEVNRKPLRIFKGMKFCMSKQACMTDPSLIYIRKNSDVEGLAYDGFSLCWHSPKSPLNPNEWLAGGNTGVAAVNLAYLLGAKRIVLLGFDMYKGLEGENNWHNVHKNLPSDEKLFRQALRFKVPAQELSERGIKVINTNPLSKIPYFKKVGFSAFMEWYRKEPKCK